MKLFKKAVLSVALLTMSPFVSAEDFPTKAVHVVVPFAAGGITDVVSRLIAQEMSDNLGQAVIVENKPGAGGSVGANLVSKARNDGYTLLITSNGNMAANKFLYKDLGYDPEADFKHVSFMFAVPYMIIANEKSGVTSIADLVQRINKNKEQFSMANGGYGTAAHLISESFSNAAGIEVSHIPYKGEAPAVTDVLGGHAPIGISSYSSIAQHIASKKINVLAVTTKERLSILPDVPTLAELGYELAINEAWFGMAAPDGMDEAKAERLHAAIDAAMKSEKVTQRIGEIGGTIANTDPSGAAEFISSEIPRWGKVIKQADIQPN